MIDLTVDGRRVEVPDGSTLLDACRSAGSEVPTLCALSTLAPANACRAVARRWYHGRSST